MGKVAWNEKETPTKTKKVKCTICNEMVEEEDIIQYEGKKICKMCRNRMRHRCTGPDLMYY